MLYKSCVIFHGELGTATYKEYISDFHFLLFIGAVRILFNIKTHKNDKSNHSSILNNKEKLESATLIWYISSSAWF